MDPFEIKTVISRPEQGWIGLFGFLSVASLVGMVVALGGGPVFLFPVCLLGMLTWLPFIRALNQRADRPAAIKVDDQGLWIDGALGVARKDISGGYVQPRVGKSPAVRVQAKRHLSDLEIEVPDLARGRALLIALGLDASRQIATFRVRQGLFSDPRAQHAVTVGLAAGGWHLFRFFIRGPITIAIALGVVALALVNLYWPTKLLVGADGLLLRSLTRRRFFPFSKVASIEPSEWGATLRLHSGKSIDLRTRPRRGDAAKDPTTHALIERVQEGLDRLKEGDRIDHASALVGRAGRSVAEWRKSLEALSAPTAGAYRGLAVPEEHLWRIATDPAAPPSARAGAAVALRPGLDDAGRARLRAAAEASAAPKVRVVLEAAADEEKQAELDKALEDLGEEDDEAAASSRRGANASTPTE